MPLCFYSSPAASFAALILSFTPFVTAFDEMVAAVTASIVVFSPFVSVFDVAVDLGLISKSGAFYRYGETMLGQGKQAAISFLEENQKMTKEIEEKIWKEVKSGKVVEEKVIGQEVEEA